MLSSWLQSLNKDTSLTANFFANLNPSLKSIVSAISSRSGADIEMGLKSCFKLSGNLLLPPYPFPAGFKVTKIPAFLLTLMFLPRSSRVG